MERRNFLKNLCFLPILAFFPSVVLGGKGHGISKSGSKPKNLVSETEGLGKNLGYKNDTKDVKGSMFKKGSNCANCIQSACGSSEVACKAVAKKAPKGYVPCKLFPGQVVSSKGWCMSWVPKG